MKIRALRRNQNTRTVWFSFNYLTIILLSCFILTSCSYKVTMRPEELKSKNNNMLIIPYKSAPIRITTYSEVATTIMTGAIGMLTYRAATKEDREQRLLFLNTNAGEWNPSITSANECANLIKKSSNVPIKNITIAIMRELPGTEKYRLDEPRVFADAVPYSLWRLLYDWVVEKEPTLKYKQEYSTSDNDLVLEIVISQFNMLDNKSMYININLKLFNANSGELLASWLKRDSFDILPIVKDSDFPVFKSEVSNAINILCSQALYDMGLIAFQKAKN